MASAAEQLAANLNLGTLGKATELKSRIWFTLGALLVYRIGTYIPVPGVDASVMGELLAQHGGGILGMFDMFSGGALGRMTAGFALGQLVGPLVNAGIARVSSSEAGALHLALALSATGLLASGAYLWRAYWRDTHGAAARSATPIHLNEEQR